MDQEDARPLPFKYRYNEEKRKILSSNIIKKHIGYIPIIIEPSMTTKLPCLTNNKYIVPVNCTIGHLLRIIRKHLFLTAETAIYILIGNVLPPTSSYIDGIYAKYKDSDGFLYISYSEESYFG